MNIIEAFKSGKRIRRQLWRDWYSYESINFCYDNVTADDWEVEPERTAPKTLTMDQVLAITTQVLSQDELLRIVNEKIKAAWMS